MSLQYLLDTNIISAPFRREPSQRVIALLSEHAGRCAICTPVWHELRFGHELMPPSRRRDALERYLFEVILPNYLILEYNRPAAEWHATERARLRQAGRPPPLLDAQIASIAVANELILVTNNTDDFSDFEDLVLEDWLS